MKTYGLTSEYLHSILRYNRRTGIFHWKVFRGGSACAGSVAGHVRKDGYVGIKINGKNCKAHRIAWVMVSGYWPKNDIDHKNGIRSDNRFLNLREATRKQNVQNASFRKDNTTGYTGVKARANGRFEARIIYKGRLLTLGTYDTALEAHERYLSAKKKVHDFAPYLRSNHLEGANPSKT